MHSFCFVSLRFVNSNESLDWLIHWLIEPKNERNARDYAYCLVTEKPKRTARIWNESVPIQLAQCWFPGLAISNAKI